LRKHCLRSETGDDQCEHKGRENKAMNVSNLRVLVLFVLPTFVAATVSCKKVQCERCSMDNSLKHLSIGGHSWDSGGFFCPSLKGKEVIVWFSGPFDPPNARFGSGKMPTIEVIEKKICDDLGREYDLDAMKIGLSKGFYDLQFCIITEKIHENAKELRLEMVLDVSGLKLHMKDELIKTPDGEWFSKSDPRLRQKMQPRRQ